MRNSTKTNSLALMICLCSHRWIWREAMPEVGSWSLLLQTMTSIMMMMMMPPTSVVLRIEAWNHHSYHQHHHHHLQQRQHHFPTIPILSRKRAAVRRRAGPLLPIPATIGSLSSTNNGDYTASDGTSIAATGATTPTHAPAPARSTTAWSQLVSQVALCLRKTNAASPKELTGMEGTSTGWANWIDEGTARELQHELLDRLELAGTTITATNKNTQQDPLSSSPFVEPSDIVAQYQSRQWLNWMMTAPKPYVWDLSLPLQWAVAQQLLLHSPDNDIKDMIGQVSCRILSFPSGMSLSRYLDTPVGTMVYGKVLSGGVERFRLLGSPSSVSTTPLRKVGQRTQIAKKQYPSSNTMSPTGNSTFNHPLNPCWLQYGGGRRSYRALDVGPALLWELALSPKATEMALMGACLNQIRDGDDDDDDSTYTVLADYDEMFTMVPMVEAERWSEVLEQLFVLMPKNNLTEEINANNQQSDFGMIANSTEFQSILCTSLGGLEPQISEIVRRVLDGRVFVPYNNNNNNNNNNPDIHQNQNRNDGNVMSEDNRLRQQRQDDMMTLQQLGITPIRGVLLYGPPGCGKTLLAREISRLVRARPKIVAAPDLLDKWVGGTEAMVRSLFVDAEEELRACQGDYTRSSLHVIVIDECDALFRKRSSLSTSSEVARSSAVNQILSKLDGVEPMDNVLLIAMTNRKELLDPALLRPGRLEVLIECPLPNVQGRREILQIQLNGLRRANRLSQTLLESIYYAREDGKNKGLDPTTNTNEKRSPRLWRLNNNNDKNTTTNNTNNTTNNNNVEVNFWSRFRQQRALATDEMEPQISFRPDMCRKGSVSTRVDLALDHFTHGFSGADLAGLVRCAGSVALARWRQQHQVVDFGANNSFAFSSSSSSSPYHSATILEGLTLTLSDFLTALQEIKESRLSPKS